MLWMLRVNRLNPVLNTLRNQVGLVDTRLISIGKVWSPVTAKVKTRANTVAKVVIVGVKKTRKVPTREPEMIYE